jgi:hypothetical protein
LLHPTQPKHQAQPAQATDNAVIAQPATAALSTVPALPAIPTEAIVIALPADATLHAVAALPAVATLPRVPTATAVTRLSLVDTDATVTRLERVSRLNMGSRSSSGSRGRFTARIIPDPVRREHPWASHTGLELSKPSDGRTRGREVFGQCFERVGLPADTGAGLSLALPLVNGR